MSQIGDNSIGPRTPSVDWRQTLSQVSPELSRAPVSIQAVKTLLRHRHDTAARSACDELIATGATVPRELVGISEHYRVNGDLQSAMHYRRQAYLAETAGLGLRGEERESAVQFCLSADGFGDPHPNPPTGYFREVFDRYAATFEQRLVGELSYCGPEMVHQRLADQLGDQFVERAILDAGCGPGLAGPLFRPHAKRLDGIDLSPAMIARADEKNVYDDLMVGELIDRLRTNAADYDLILAIDTLIYFDDLLAFFQACRHALVDGGMLAVTIESGPDGGGVTDRRRYSHDLASTRQSATDAGLSCLHAQKTTLRHERGRPLEFYIVLFQAAPPGNAN